MTVASTIDTEYLREQAKEEARPRRNSQRYNQRRAQVDMRTRIGKRLREIEKGLRAEVLGQGRVISIHTDLLIGSAAQLMLQIEHMRGLRNAGELVDGEELTRAVNSLARAIGQLGLRPSLAEPPKPRPSLASMIRDNHGD